MSELADQNPKPLPNHTFISMILVSIGSFLVIGPGALLVFDLDQDSLGTILSDPANNPQAKIPIYIIQGTASLIGFVIVPLIYLSKIQIPFFRRMVVPQYPSVRAILQTAFIAVTFMVVLAPVVEWNANMTLPGFLFPLEEWARHYEWIMEQMTQYLTHFDNPGLFVLGVVVIAIIPAVGEELLFRGVVQNQIFFLTSRPHLAIWIAAFLFSAVHLQFFGFLPRMLLGVLLGYLYYWSGNLLIPILAHFVNNGIILTIIYLHQLGVIEFDLRSTDQIELLPVILSILVVSGLILNFRNSFRKDP